jgi:hypothetical protein
MRALILMASFAAALSNAPGLASGADSVSKFDIVRECGSEGGSQAVQDKCAQDEATARDQLQPLGIQLSAADKANCVKATSADGTPSYVELLTCPEMARQA